MTLLVKRMILASSSFVLAALFVYWLMGGGDRKVQAWPLSFVLFFGLIVLPSMMLVTWWLKQRKMPVRFSVRTLLLATRLVAVAVAVIVYAVR